MKKILIFVLAFVICDSTLAIDIIGKWELDKEISNSFNLKYSQMSEAMKELKECGVATIEFLEKNALLKKDPYSCFVGGKKLEIPGYDLNRNYEIIVNDDKKKIVIIKFAIKEGFIYQTYHFTDKDSFWVYTGEDGIMESAHFREYYVRVH